MRSPAGFKVFLAAEELKVHVLRPAFDDTVVAQVVGVLELKQGHHQADRQSGPAGRADSCTGHSHGGTVQVRTLNDSASTITVLKKPAPGSIRSASTACGQPAQPAGGEGQSWRQAGRGKNRWLPSGTQPSKLPETDANWTCFREFRPSAFTLKSRIHAGSRGFATPTTLLTP